LACTIEEASVLAFPQFIHEKKCTFCGSRHTVRFGGRRRRCNACKHTFRVETRGKKSAPAFHDRYVLDRSTYRRVGTTSAKSHVTILKNLQRDLTGAVFANPNTPSGILILDGKALSIRGEKYCEHLVWDTGAGLLKRRLCPGKESPQVFDDLLQELLEQDIVFRAATIDGLPGLTQVLQTYGIYVERCHIHMLRDLKTGLQLKRFSHHPGNRQKRILSRYCHLLLHATPETFLLRWKHLERIIEANVFGLNPIHHNVLRRFKKACRHAFTHFVDHRIPTTTNRLESYISHFNARLTTMRGFKNPENADRILIALHNSLLKSP